MDIDDILAQPQHKSIDDFLTKEMKRLSGDALYKKMEEVWGNEKQARQWFYSHAISLGKRPYDACKDGKADDVEQLIGRIEYGVYS